MRLKASMISKDWLNNFNFDIIVLSETWLSYDFKILLNGYQTINAIGKLNKSDGVTVFVKKLWNRLM